jgi:hypothetical protein
MEGGKSFALIGLVVTFLVVCITVAGGCGNSHRQAVVTDCPITPREKTELWNGCDLAGWKLFVEDESVDAGTVWSVREGVIHCAGKPFGYMRTLADYTDYKLHVEWRWAEEPTNSGIFVHMSEPDMIWPESIECQLYAGHAGDLITIGNTDFKEREDKSKRVVGKKTESSEKPPGEWNEADILCSGDTVRIFVNGVLQNEATETNVTSGKICLQSEGSPIEFRNVYVEPLKPCQKTAGWVRLFDAGSFAGWEGNLDLFRIEDGAIVGGTLKKKIPRNEFLCTLRRFSDFELRLKVKLLGEDANAGIQIRSRRIPNHHEMIGYQADMGQHYWGCLYDESRRKKILANVNRQELDKVLKLGDWNEYVIRCEAKRIQLWINGYQTVDYTEPDDTIEQRGVIGLQIHSGSPSEAWYKDITIKEIDCQK